MTPIQSVIITATKQLEQTSDSPALDAEVLLCFILGRQRSYLRAWPEKLLLPEQEDRFMSLLEKRYAGHPIAYLTGTREFWSRDFITTPDVLIPRPETELLIELCLDLIPDNTPQTLIDLGTGSGAIAITLAAERPAIEVTATDYSAKALTIARQNARQLGINNIQFFQSHWFDNVSGPGFDFIVSNPPYIAPNDPHLREGDLQFEPTMALIAEQQGLQDINSIVKTAIAFLNPGGHLLIEHGYDQQEKVQCIFHKYQYTNIQTHTDLSNLPRVISAQAS